MMARLFYWNSRNAQETENRSASMDGETALWVIGPWGCDWNCRNACDPDGPL